MSEKEKEAILELKHFSNMTPYWKQEEYSNSQVDNYIKIVLNLIEKQQEENKKLKELLQKKNQYTHELEKDLFEGCSNYVVRKDEIREKIKELEKIKNTEVEIFSHDFLTLERTIKVLQELLEEE